MLIDWFTVIAQAVNFLILVWLMKRFLYQPILSALDAREKRIAAELADADAKKAEAQMEREEFKHKNDEFDQQRAALLSKATDEANAEHRRLFDEARKAANALSAKRMETLRNDAHNLSQAISRRTQQEVFAIARKALADLATTSLEERLGEVFTRRLREMDGQAKAGLAEALKTASAPALVRSAFDLPAEQRTAIQNALNETFSAEIHVRFEAAPDLVSGIELTTNGQKVVWSISDYLVSLEKGVDELLKEKDKAEAQAQAKKPSDLTQQIGKRAYELYEEHGHKEGLAVQDWDKAEREIRKEILKPVKTEPKPEAKAKPKPEVKPQAKAELEPVVEAKLENKVAPKPAAKADPESAAKAEAKPATEVEPKPEAKVEPEPEPEAKPENKVESKPSAKAEPEPEANTNPKPQ
jgi:F-type H+-transporting ATPase subunit b